MDPSAFKEFLVYFIHDKQLVVLKHSEIIFKECELIVPESQILLDGIYEGDIFPCILVQCGKEDGDISEEAVNNIRKMKEKLRISTILEKVPRFKTGRYRVPVLNNVQTESSSSECAGPSISKRLSGFGLTSSPKRRSISTSNNPQHVNLSRCRSTVIGASNVTDSDSSEDSNSTTHDDTSSSVMADTETTTTSFNRSAIDVPSADLSGKSVIDLLNALLSESKKQTKLLKKLTATHGTAVPKEIKKFLNHVDKDGVPFSTRDLPMSTPNRFAIALVKRVRGQEYISQHSFDPAPGTKHSEPASGDIIDLLKKSLSAVWSDYDWTSVKDSLNQAGRDIRKKSKKMRN